MTRWNELVFHVLAHVRADVPSSVYDAEWVAFANVGDPLFLEDVARLEAMRLTHEALAEVQLLAFLFESVARAERVADRALAELAPEDVDDPRLLSALMASPALPVVEVLRAAAELAREAYEDLRAPRALSMDQALMRVAEAAPHLSRCRLEQVRPLRLRGRAIGRRVWVGLPCATLGPSAEHVAHQAAHEATVVEVAERARALGLVPAFLPLEQCALLAFRERARAAGLGDEHARWLAHFGRLPPFERDAIEPAYRALVTPEALARSLVSERGERSGT